MASPTPFANCELLTGGRGGYGTTRGGSAGCGGRRRGRSACGTWRAYCAASAGRGCGAGAERQKRWQKASRQEAGGKKGPCEESGPKHEKQTLAHCARECKNYPSTSLRPLPLSSATPTIAARRVFLRRFWVTGIYLSSLSELAVCFKMSESPVQNDAG